MSFYKKVKKKLWLWKQITIQNMYNKKELKAKKMVVFFIPQVKMVNGGVMSIFSLCTYTRQILSDAASLLCTHPSPQTYAYNDFFPNQEKIWRFDQIVKHAMPEELILHIPEYVAGEFYNCLTDEQKNYLKKIKKLQINILNQNILIMPEKQAWQNLFSLTKHITQTTAHDKYATQEICNKFGVPLKHFSVRINSTVEPIPFEKKEKLIVFSPDENSYMPLLKEKIHQNLKGYKIQIVKNLTYGEYLKLIAKAFAVVSFGEGFDGYFSQPSCVGTVGFAVYNQEFFPSTKWKTLKNVYDSYPELIAKFSEDIRYFEKNKESYYETQKKQLELLSELYNEDAFINNLKCFYQEKYDFYPEK